MANMAKREVTVTQLRAINYEYAARFGAAVAATAADIVAATEDPEVVEHALRWRMWALPQARAASFGQDPLASLIELWILASQQYEFFSSGNGRAWFGDQQQDAIATSEQLQHRAEALMSEAMSSNALASIKQTKGGWVQTHPIEGNLVARPTARADLASLVPPQQMGTLRAVGSLQEVVGDMNDRITILTAQAPVEARWQAEYLVAALFEESVRHDMDTVVESLRTMTEFVGGLEETLAVQTETIFESIQDERVMVFEAVERERAEIIGAIQGERSSILGRRRLATLHGDR